MTDPKAAPETPTDEPTGPPAGADTPATDEPDADADSFPRAYVEKLRKESAGYRTERDQLAELLGASQRQLIDNQIQTHGIKSDAVWKTIDDPIELIGEDGLPDPEKIRAAVAKARETLGIRAPGLRTGLRSGSTSGPQPSERTFADAFKPRER